MPGGAIGGPRDQRRNTASSTDRKHLFLLPVSNLKPIKGHDVLLEAVARPGADASRWCMVLVGEDYQTASCSVTRHTADAGRRCPLHPPVICGSAEPRQYSVYLTRDPYGDRLAQRRHFVSAGGPPNLENRPEIWYLPGSYRAERGCRGRGWVRTKVAADGREERRGLATNVSAIGNRGHGHLADRVGRATTAGPPDGRRP
jgi:hypothetical protein